MSKLTLTSASYVIPSDNGEPGDIDARSSLRELHSVYSGEYTECKYRLDNIDAEKHDIETCIKLYNEHLKTLRTEKQKLENCIIATNTDIQDCEDSIDHINKLHTDDLELEKQGFENDRHSKKVRLQESYNIDVQNVEKARQDKLNSAKYDFEHSSNGNISPEDFNAITKPNQIQAAAIGNVASRIKAKNTLNELVESKIQSANYDIVNLESEIQNLNNSIQSVNNKYNPLIDECQEEVNKVYAKYAGNIEAYTAKINESISNQNAEIEDLNSQLDAEVKSANTQISNINSDIKRVKHEYDRQIRDAESQGKATTRLKQGKASKISKLEADITKIKNNYEKAKTKIERQAQVVNDQYKREQDKIRDLKEALIAKRNEELVAPSQELNTTKQEKDLKIANLMTEINNCKNTINEIVVEKDNYVAEQNNIYNSTISELDILIREFANNTNIEVGPEVDDSIAPFKNLESKVENWNRIVNKLCKKEDKLEALKSNIESSLDNKYFEELVEDASKANLLPDKPNFLASSKLVIMIIGVILSITGGVTIAFNAFNVALCIGLLIVGIVAIILPNVIYSKTLKNYTKAIVLATGYMSFTGVINHSNETILNEKVRILLDLGERLNNIKTAFFGGKRAYEDKIAKINNEYNVIIRNLDINYNKAVRNVDEEHDNILLALNKEIETFNSNNNKKLKDEKARLNELNLHKNVLTYELKRKEQDIEECKNNIALNEEDLSTAMKFEADAPNIIENFRAKTEELLRTLVVKCAKEENTAIIKDTKYVLDDSIFLGLGNDYCKDSHNVQEVIEYTHNKKPIIVVYDENIQKLPGKTVVESLNSEISKVVIDLVTGFRFINSKATLMQYIIDLPICVAELAGEQKKKMNCVSYYTNKLDDMKKYLEEINDSRAEMNSKEISHIDELNKRSFEKGAEPKHYNVVYFILRPDEDITKPLDNVILSDCDKYGFLPVFIISNKMWNGNTDGKSSFINNLIDNNTNYVIKYANRKYTVESEDDSFGDIIDYVDDELVDYVAEDDEIVL